MRAGGRRFRHPSRLVLVPVLAGLRDVWLKGEFMSSFMQTEIAVGISEIESLESQEVEGGDKFS